MAMNEPWGEVSVVRGSSAEQADSKSRCLACDLPITSQQQVFQIRGLVVHLTCAVYRRQLLRR
jgi:hypothetical protein